LLAMQRTAFTNGCFLTTMQCFCCRFSFANWIGHILRRNCLLKQVIEEKIKGQI
jgi:hypothetical protein